MTSRQRDRSFGPIMGGCDWEHCDQYGNVTNSGTVSVVSKHVTEVMDDVVTPNFQSRRNSGEIIVNPCLYVKETVETVGAGHIKLVRTDGSTQEWTNNVSSALLLYGGPGYKPGPLPHFDVASAARLQALGNIDRSPYQFGEDVGEIRETLGFLEDPFRSLERLGEAFTEKYTKEEKILRRNRRQHVMPARKENVIRARALAKAWTAYQFAFLPLLRSSIDLLEAVSTKVHRPERRTARGKSEFNAVLNDKVNPSFQLWERITSYTVTQKAGILYEVSNPINDWRYKYGLRSKDIPETLWQLFPLSFLVDRMYNISAMLRSLSFFLDPNIKILGAWTTEKSETVASVSFQRFSDGQPFEPLIQEPDFNVKKNFRYSRQVWEPTIIDSIPSLNVYNLVDSSTKFADVAAILALRLKGLY